MSESSYHHGSEVESSPSDHVEDSVSRVSSRQTARSVDRKRSRSRSVAGLRKRRLTGYVKNNYVQLLNQSINTTHEPDSAADIQSLPPSQVGASLWTSAEKDHFFKALARCGPGDLKALANAVASKSEFEVHVYLNLLQAGSAEVNSSFAQQHVPAAAEISLACEDLLEQTADLLSFRVAEQESATLREQHGDDFLVNGDVAELQERLYRETCDEEEGASIDQKEPGWGESSGSDNSASSDGQLHPTERADRGQRSAKSDIPSSARLLSPLAFLDLADRIFMNGPLGSGSNWRDHIFADELVTGPCIYQEALDDFYAILISLTRRLIQSAIFQAMSRLRAMDATRKNYTPVLRVTNVDVNTAADMLGLKQDRMQYWARIPRLYQLQVYSDSKKYNDGRPGSKNGHRLSLEEAETELGLIQCPVTLDEPVSDVEFDDDSWMSVDSRGRSDMSPSQAYQVEDDHLEALDMSFSREEEEILWGAVHGRRLSKRTQNETTDSIPATPKPVVEKVPLQLWRNRLEYEPPWTHIEGSPDLSAFQAMQARRRMKSELKQELLEGIHGTASDVDSVSRDRARVVSEHSDSHDEDDEEDFPDRAASEDEDDFAAEMDDPDDLDDEDDDDDDDDDP